MSHSFVDYEDHPRAIPFGWRAWAWIAGATVLALVLRLMGLGEWSIWVDEAHSFRDATVPFDEFARSGRSRYPAAFLALRWHLDAIGGTASEGWIRLPFAAFGILTVPLLAIVARPLVGIVPAVLAAWLLAVHPWHIFWSQNARGYVVVGFFAVACLGFAWTAWNRRSVMAWVWAGICAVLAGFSHPSGWALVPVAVTFGLLARLDGHVFATRRFWGIAALGVAVLGGLVLMSSHLPVVQEFTRAKPDPMLGHLLETTAYYFRVPFLLAMIAGLCFVTREGRAQGVLLTCWLFLPGLALVLFGALVVKTTARFGFLVLPAVLLVASLGAVHLATIVRDKVAGVRGGILAAILPAVLVFDALAYDYLYFRVQYGDRPRWREALTWIQNDAGGRASLVLSTNQPSTTFYLAPTLWRGDDPQPWDIGGLEAFSHKNEGGPMGKIQQALDLRETMIDDVENAPGVYVLITRPELAEMDPGGAVYEFLRTRLRLVAEYRSWVGPKDHTLLLFSHPGPDGAGQDPNRPR